MYVKDLSETKYEFLIKKREDARTKHLNDLSAFIECYNTMDDINENIDDYKQEKESFTCVWWHDCRHYDK